MSLIEINPIAAHVFNKLQKGKQRNAAWHIKHNLEELVLVLDPASK
jgi:hypothetical protein